MHDYLLVTDLVARAGNGEKQARDALVAHRRAAHAGHRDQRRSGHPPVSSTGPTRARCLDKLRRDPAVVALTSAETAPREMPGRALAQ